MIGAGLPRTGTLSLKAALTQLYHGKCYHMMDVAAGDQEDVNAWLKACRFEFQMPMSATAVQGGDEYTRLARVLY